MKALSHVDENGRAAMVDVGMKKEVGRFAEAVGKIRLTGETIALIQSNGLKKGDVLAVARVAGIMAAKQCSSLIPLCHPLLIDSVTVGFTVEEQGIEIRASASCRGRTGIEMEVLTAVSVAALTIWDMCKAVDGTMEIEAVRLLHKRKEEK
jgi:cyclic pyranopterin phosphate synthase